MEAKAIEKFRVIGACGKMQKISWEEEIELIEGVVFDINFFQDFSPTIIHEIMEELEKPDEEYISADSKSIALEGGYQTSKMFWEDFERRHKKEKKRERKWKRKWEKNKKKRLKRAEKIFGIKL